MWGTLLTLLIGASAFAGPLLLGRLLARGATHGDGANPAVPVAIVLLSIAASTCFAAARAFCILRIRASSASTAASALLDRTLRQTPTWHRQRPFGERFGQAAAVMNASTAMPDDAVARLLDLVVVGGSMAAVATTSWSLFAATVAVLVVEAAVVTAFLRATRARAAARAEAGLVVAGRLQELLKGVTRLRVTGAQSRALLHWARAQVVLSRADQQLRRMRAAHYVVLGVWPAVVLVAVVAVAGVSNASLESLLTTQLALAAAGGSIAAAVFAADSGMIADSALRRALPVLASPPEGGHHLRSPGTLQGAIGARDLVFRYHENGPAVLDHVSIRVSPGEHVAVVGPSGCGKTTLMRVLLGLEHAESGTLTFDGVDLALLDQPAVRRQIGSVLQSAELLPSSIRRNVDMGRGLGAADIWAALDTAGLGAEVRQMPLGLDTPVSDGSGTLSGGQRQRVLIARALASNPRVLVLDEATSALDNVSQAAVVDVLGRLRITRVTVAHRLSTIRHADRIFVMEAGRVVDEGTFDELMARNELFRAMAMRQQA
jgi:ABC-type bacteriocin/lantibiotic exporter with double-glycine peptidase domain